MASSAQSVAEAVSQAQTILEAAEKRAADLIAQAEKKLRDAKEKGHKEGFAEGQREAVATAIRLVEESGSLSTSLAEQAATLALAICRSIIEEELAIKPDVVRKIAIKALQESAITDSVTILVNAQDKSAIDRATTDLQRIVGNGRLIIETDAAITRGGCIVRTDFGEVDATIESLLEGIATRLGVHREKRGER